MLALEARNRLASLVNTSQTDQRSRGGLSGTGPLKTETADTSS